MDQPWNNGEEHAAIQPAPRQEAWNSLRAAGLDFLGKLGQAAQSSPGDDPAVATLGNLIGRNEKTGGPEFRIPLPDPQTARQLGSLLSNLGDAMKSFGSEPGDS
jgi:hypothetical protein